MESQQEGLTARIARQALAAYREPLPPRVQALARQCMLDWVAVALAGAGEPVARILRAQAADEGGSPLASAVGGGARFTPSQAALINGATGHAIDYDDANIGAQGHISTAVLPAALAIAQWRDAGGEQLLRAFAAGYHAAGTVGHYVGRAHYARGFHGTGTVGSFGAAVAAALLLGLDEAGLVRAMGIAGSQAAGLKAQFGTMCKPFHAGKAAENGVRAAQFAARGMSSCEEILEAPQGFGAVASPDSERDRALATPAGGHHLGSNLFKYHAACYGTHSVIDAVAALRTQHRLTAAAARRIELRVEAAAEGMCNIARPRTGLQAKFSLTFNAALALAGEDTAAPTTYEDATVGRADLCALCDRVAVRLMPPPWPGMLAEVTIETVDGRVLQGRADSAVPRTDIEAQGERLARKFRALVGPLRGPQRTEALLALLDSLPPRPVRELMALLE